jgi:hypothetical protein
MLFAPASPLPFRSFIMSDLSVFDKHGNIRTDFTDTEIAALSPERQELWGALIAANDVMQGAETVVRDATAQIDRSVGERRLAETALAEARPRISAVEAARQQARAHRGEPNPPPDPAVEKRILAAAAAVDAAAAAVAAARRDRTVAEEKVKSARVVFAKALQNWNASGKVVKQRDLIAAVNATIPAREMAEKVMTSGPPSRLDAVMAMTGGKRGYSIDHQRSRHVPSER